MKTIKHFSNIQGKWDAIIIESMDVKVSINSPVSISLYNTKTKSWNMGLNIITTMKDALTDERKKVSIAKNVEEFLTKYYAKKNKRTK